MGRCQSVTAFIFFVEIFRYAQILEYSSTQIVSTYFYSLGYDVQNLQLSLHSITYVIHTAAPVIEEHWSL